MKHEESQLQISCLTWFRYQYSTLSKMLFAIPNSGSRNKRLGGIMKAEGMTAGVADLILLMPNKTYSALCIEMKAGKGKQSPAQKEWSNMAQLVGNRYVVVNSFDQFKKEIEEYFKNVE